MRPPRCASTRALARVGRSARALLAGSAVQRSMLAALLLALTCTLFAPAIATAGPPAPSSPEFGPYVMRKLDDEYRGAQSHAKMSMEVRTAHFERSLTMEAWSLGTDYSLVRLLSPRLERGTATLKAKNDLFIYLSKTGRTIKIGSGMMGGSWMGSHFTNDDLVRHSRLSRDYHIGPAADASRGGVSCHVFVLTPKPDAPVVWGKLDIGVRKSDLEPVFERFYDEDGKAVRELEFSDYRQVDELTVPMKMVMRPLDGSGEYTRLTYQALDFGVKLDKGFFSLQRLKSL